MKQRAIEILFKRRFLILLPLLVIMPLTIALALRPKEAKWEVYSVVWVDQYKELYEDARLGNTPGPNQAQILKSLIRTRTFARTVLEQTPLAPRLATPSGELDAIGKFWRSVQTLPNDNSFITLIVTMPDPDLAYATMQSLLTNYSAVLQQRSDLQSQVAISFYAEAAGRAETAVAKSRQSLADYLTAHPELLGRNLDGSLASTARDTNFARLTQQVSSDEASYNALRQRYDALVESAAAGRKGQQFAFSVIDEPQRPYAPVAQGRLQLVRLPATGLALALVLSAVIAVLLILTNRTVLGAYDVQDTLGIKVLGEIPELRRRRWPWQRAPRDAVRHRLAEPAYSAA